MNWQALAADKKRRQQDLIPQEWLIATPPDNVLDITAVPNECGLLSDKEIEITETQNVDVLLQKLATAQWSSLEVTTAFTKEPSLLNSLYELNKLTVFRNKLMLFTGELSHRDFYTASLRPRC